MSKYLVIITEKAQQDMRDFSNVVAIEYKSPLTAKKYLTGIYDQFRWLRTNAESFNIQTRKMFVQYGLYVRRLNYKKMTIIYTVNQTTVYIHRVIPANTIGDL
ncbi:MAG TPA: type II toxin-antitoxin system RelE/ParE family toxin [Paludibacter sp.]|nr:type II toxin-antitoxin system RelE/ParE family toxin [Paludibacter sp.]